MGLSRDRLTKDEEIIENIKTHNGLSCEPAKRFIGYTHPVEIDSSSAVDNINHPPHYNNSQAICECGRRIECIDITRHLSFNIGNAIKYLWRCELKNNTLEDLKKAAWYLQDEISKREKTR